MKVVSLVVAVAARPRCALAFLPLLAAACATQAPAPYDYGPYLEHMPRSILVLPPLNESHEVDAGYSYLSTVTSPLAERGYYVFPVALVDELMKQNGCPTAGEMHQVPIGKLREVFGADAVLYLKVKQWGTVYRVFDSVTTLEVEGRLVDAANGEQFWSNSAVLMRSTAEHQDNAVVMLVAAVVNQIASSVSDQAHGFAPQLNAMFVADPHHGMLVGERSPGFHADQISHRLAPEFASPPSAHPDRPRSAHDRP